MKTSLNLLAFFVLLGRVSGQCSLCPGGSSSITDTNAVLVPDSILDQTCGEIEADVATAADADCDGKKVTTNVEINYSAFCCSDVQPSNSCPFCDGFDIDENEAVPPDLSNFINTCGEAAALAVYLTGTTICDTVVNVGSESCCIPPTDVPTPSPTISTNPTRAPTTAPPTDAPDVPPTTLAPLSAANRLSVAAVTIMGLFTWFAQM
jgi:hypothetical protein